MSHDTPQEFPSDFPIKVMGRHDSDLRALTQTIIERHAGPQPESSIRTRTSTDGNFLALTYLVHATSREQLDAIYRELTACKSVLMAL
jgi:putative lipoic acid-binding regulatory protein